MSLGLDWKACFERGEIVDFEGNASCCVFAVRGNFIIGSTDEDLPTTHYFNMVKQLPCSECFEEHLTRESVNVAGQSKEIL